MPRITRQKYIGLLVGLIAWSAATGAVLAQDRRDGDRDGGRDGGRGDRQDEFRGPSFSPGGGFGPPSGGFGFGPPGGGFGSPGGGFGPPGAFNPADMLRRLDENNNGMIDPDESGGRARFFLDRMVRDVPGIDLSRPVSIDRLSQAIQRARENAGRDNRSSNSSSNSSSPGASKQELLVPAFGVEENLPLPLAFGVKGEVFSIKISDEDQREAADRLRRYDENRDGVLDREEIGRNRWSDDPFVYDQNRDGKLSVTELAMRYARRRATENNSRGSSSGSDRFANSGRGGPPGSPGSSGSGDPRSDMMVRFMMERNDRNRNGSLEKDEWPNTPGGDLSAADTNKDNRITRDELAAWASSRQFGRGFGGGGFSGFGGGFGSPPSDDERFSFRRDEGDRREGGRDGERDRSRDGDRNENSRDGGSSFYSRRTDDAKSSSSTAKTSDLKSYRALTPTERLPKGLPDWFARNDGNGDGQVAMAEFSASWSDSVIRDFHKFDLNDDGFITAKECLKATDKGAMRGVSSGGSSSGSSPRDSSSTSTATAAPAGASDSTAAKSAAAPAATSTSDSTSPAATEVTINSRMLAYAQGVIKKYDINGDAILTKEEWMSMSKDPTNADSDGDGKITSEEFAIWTVRQ